MPTPCSSLSLPLPLACLSLPCAELRFPLASWIFLSLLLAKRKPSEDHLVLWILGGPGCYSLTGLAFDIGHLYFKISEYDGSLPTLVLNPNSWTKVSNIIFLDAPVGTGFSYSRSIQGSNSTDTKSAKQTDNFL